MSVDHEDVAERVRRACLRAATEAYEDAGMQGLCAEGRWELALDAVRTLDLSDVATAGGPHPATPIATRAASEEGGGEGTDTNGTGARRGG